MHMLKLTHLFFQFIIVTMTFHSLICIFLHIPFHFITGPSSIPDEDGVDLTQVFILHWSINGYLGQPREGKLWKPGFHAGPLSRGKGLFHHRLKGQGDGRWAPAATRWYSVSPPLYLYFTTILNKLLRKTQTGNWLSTLFQTTTLNRQSNITICW